MTQPTQTPTLKNILLYIAIIIIAVWLLGYLLKFAAWLLNLVLVVGAILLIIWLIQTYILSRRK